MRLLELEYRVRGYRRSHEERHPGYLDTFTVTLQYFVLERRWLGCIRLPSTQLFTEEVPQNALIQLACLGYMDWRSAAPQWMFNEQNNHNWGSLTSILYRAFSSTKTTG